MQPIINFQHQYLAELSPKRTVPVLNWLVIHDRLAKLKYPLKVVVIKKNVISRLMTKFDARERRHYQMIHSSSRLIKVSKPEYSDNW